MLASNSYLADINPSIATPISRLDVFLRSVLRIQQNIVSEMLAVMAKSQINEWLHCNLRFKDFDLLSNKALVF